jgi:hypothetical protein
MSGRDNRFMKRIGDVSFDPRDLTSSIERLAAAGLDITPVVAIAAVDGHGGIGCCCNCNCCCNCSCGACSE